MLKTMDFPLLNAFHDEPFDGNYSNYEIDMDDKSWSHANELSSFQLSETLNGILPLSATDDVNLIYADSNSLFSNNNLNLNTSIETESINAKAECLASLTRISPNIGDFIQDNVFGDNAPSTYEVTGTGFSAIADREEQQLEENNLIWSEQLSQSSYTTFRSRTDSSSIGDYESHSSDYDDDYKLDIKTEFLPAEQTAVDVPHVPKARTLSTKTTDSDSDLIGINIDPNTFDLTDYITKDDIPVTDIAETQTVVQKQICSASESRDSDSDVIVDVETLENNSDNDEWFPPAAAEDVQPYKDNIKDDPSWMPPTKTKRNIVTKIAETKSGKKNTENVATGNTKNHKCDYLQNKTKQTQNATAKMKETLAVPQNERNKSLNIIKQQLKSCNGYISSPEKTKSNSNEHMPNSTIVKRKLNLEEYKRRKLNGGSVNGAANNIPAKTSKVVKHSEEVTAVVKSLREQQQKQQSTIPTTELNTTTTANTATDPLTIAKNKVLRMQALKRAKQLKLLDSTISAKVPRVTKLLPLKDMIKEGYCASALLEAEPETKLRNQQTKQQQDAAKVLKKSADTEMLTITFLSIGCNTQISIPPRVALNIQSDVSRSLLKNPIPKISSNSLLSSIQKVMLQKLLPDSSLCMESENKIIMHVPKKERLQLSNKCIKHMLVQTDFQVEFPALVCWPKLITTRYKPAHVEPITTALQTPFICRSTLEDDEISCASSTDRKLNGGGYASSSHASSNRHRSSVSSSDSEQTACFRRQRRTSYKQRRAKKHEHRSDSFSSSLSDSSGDEATRHRLHAGSRSRSPSTVYGERYHSAVRNVRYNNNDVSQPAVEERRIVYVGRIEEETTKEMLRRKFLRYGTIKQITIHYKQTGMKYGFVTYERSQDAFTAIDESNKDPQINMYDISFGGRRAFCRATYADLDNAGINTYESYVYPQQTAAASSRSKEVSFEQLLLKVKAEMSAKVTANTQIEKTNI